MNLSRIWAIVLRHILQMKRDITRMTEIIWYPIIDLVIWGLVTTFLQSSEQGIPLSFLFFVGGTILWILVYRMQTEMAISLLLDVWDRNLLNIFTSPITSFEFLAGLTIVSLLKLFITFTILSFLAIFLYAFNLFTLGIFLLPFVCNLLLMGWWMGVAINGVILRFGYRVESVGWALVYIFNPLSGVFFPVSTMPPWMQTAASFIPASYVFEGMREALAYGTVSSHLLFMSFLLNGIYTIAAILWYGWMFESAKQSGILAKMS